MYGTLYQNGGWSNWSGETCSSLQEYLPALCFKNDQGKARVLPGTVAAFDLAFLWRSSTSENVRAKLTKQDANERQKRHLIAGQCYSETLKEECKLVRTPYGVNRDHKRLFRVRGSDTLMQMYMQDPKASCCPMQKSTNLNWSVDKIIGIHIARFRQDS
ncbi:hypothetical protein STEG23_023002 [Scotinomys teguina]